MRDPARGPHQRRQRVESGLKRSCRRSTFGAVGNVRKPPGASRRAAWIDRGPGLLVCRVSGAKRMSGSGAIRLPQAAPCRTAAAPRYPPVARCSCLRPSCGAPRSRSSGRSDTLFGPPYDPPEVQLAKAHAHVLPNNGVEGAIGCILASAGNDGLGDLGGAQGRRREAQRPQYGFGETRGLHGPI